MKVRGSATNSHSAARDSKVTKGTVEDESWLQTNTFRNMLTLATKPG